MPPVDVSVGSTKRSSWTSVLVAIVALFVGAGVTYVLAVMGAGGKVDISKGGVSIEVAANENFSSFLGKALAKDEKTVRALLASHSYYHLSSDEFLSELRNIDPNTPEGKRIGEGMRRMLANLEGPFQRPGTFFQADGKLMEAIEDLDQAVSGAREASALIATLWKQNLEQLGVFRVRRFPADINVLEHVSDGSDVIYACSGGALGPRHVIEIFTGNGTSIRGEIRIEPQKFDCTKPPIDVQTMLTEQVPVPLGISVEAFKVLYPEGTGSQSREEAIEDPKFVVFPLHMESIFSKEG